MKLDSRQFSQKAYTDLNKLAQELHQDYHRKASGIVQGLTAYISTWGLHRLIGDAKKFSKNKVEDTNYKSTVYKQFLTSLKEFSDEDFDIDNEGSLVNMDLKKYTALNRLAIELSKEWSFWSSAVLGEPEEE